MREHLANHSRRHFFKGNTVSDNALRLPWSKDEASFVESCDQCSNCLAACENKIIVRDERGFPKIDFSKGECSFCLKCIESCHKPLFAIPTNCSAIDNEPLTVAEKTMPWQAELVIDDSCLAKSLVYCQSCRDICETEAIEFCYQFEAGVSVLPRPQILLADCTLCGACISSCPQSALKIELSNNEVPCDDNRHEQ
ncbi:MAG: ferredoxin-type protein NapF [Kangiellaceae bacterium]|nr:ferredoxin-type protein NapF [Kangiellaceae bacterium]